ncbi:potassium channel family protein [Promicromonospora sp. NPDC057138]|uniref:potassium channel family protein n=1 Tax=Promicromonospora sp. NPDC057138 TaxID=3346031 RepID=UPI00362A6B9F
MQARDPQQDGGGAEARSSGAGAEPGGTSAWRRRTMITFGLLRAGATSVLLVVLYYLLPLDRDSVSHLTLILILGLAGFAATAYWEVRSIIRSRLPGIRAIHALATLVPFFLLLFASTYFVLSYQAPATFSEPLTRSDALYFTITTFATVGFGDVVPRSEAVRLLVSGQILLDLVILGLGIRVIIGAVKKGRTTEA